MKFKDVYNLPSGRIFIYETDDGCLIESTEMQDVSTSKQIDEEVRNSLDPKIIWNHLVPKKDKWLFTVSTQKGCPHNCKFCDVAPLPFKGNLNLDEILNQVVFMLDHSPEYSTAAIGETISNKAKIGFARMGEPAHNLETVLEAMDTLKVFYSNLNWLPCFNSILPTSCMGGVSGEDVLRRVLDFKESVFDGFLHLQISCNSTDEDKRKELFGGADVLPLERVVSIVNEFPITTRTIALNFIVMEDVPVDIAYLKKLGLNGDKFVVKLIPLNTTDNSVENELKTYANYASYSKLQQLTEEFKQAGVPVIMDSIARCEEAGLCCGQLAHRYIK